MTLAYVSVDRLQKFQRLIFGLLRIFLLLFELIADLLALGVDLKIGKVSDEKFLLTGEK